MTNRIDHVGQALLFERSSDAIITGNTPAMAPHILAVIELDKARLHAQLAMVEQQRIANLIAAFEMEGGPHKETNNWTRSEVDANMHIRREVREGLGL